MKVAFKVKTSLNETLLLKRWISVRRGDKCDSSPDSVAAAVQLKKTKKTTCSSFVGVIHSGKLVFRCRGDMASGPNVHCNLMLQSSSLLPSHRAALALFVFLPGFSVRLWVLPSHQHNTVLFIM